MFGSINDSTGDYLLGGVVVLAFLVAVYLAAARLWKQRGERRHYRERDRLRRRFWGWS